MKNIREDKGNLNIYKWLKIALKNIFMKIQISFKRIKIKKFLEFKMTFGF